MVSADQLAADRPRIGRSAAVEVGLVAPALCAAALAAALGEPLEPPFAAAVASEQAIAQDRGEDQSEDEPVGDELAGLHQPFPARGAGRRRALGRKRRQGMKAALLG